MKGMPDERDRNRYAEIFEHAPIARLITDADGTIHEANRYAARLLEVRADSVVGIPLATFVSDEDRPAFVKQLLAVGGTTQPTTWVMWVRAKPEKAPFRAEVHVVASQSEVGSLHWAITDVTWRTAMEQELRMLTSELETRVEERTREVEAERARLAAVIEQIPAGLTIVGPDGAVITANAVARRLLGDRLEDAFEEGRTDLQSDDGRYVALDVSIAPIIDAEGKRVGEIRLFHDVSARDQQERAEREFVSNAAHQLQSPLAGILSAIEVLQAGAKDGPDREVFLGHIERETNRLARLARALLTLARAQTGYEAPKDELVALEPLLSDIAGSLRTVNGVEVKVACPPTLAVVTNRELVEQAIVNVAENASKYTVQGQIRLEASWDGDAAKIVVTDTGRGIDRKDTDRVLERFYRAAGNGADGFGLGFAIVRSAVSALDGDLELKSEPGVGTTVTIRLPRAASMVEA